jgi:hypothetical protein
MLSIQDFTNSQRPIRGIVAPPAINLSFFEAAKEPKTMKEQRSPETIFCEKLAAECGHSVMKRASNPIFRTRHYFYEIVFNLLENKWTESRIRDWALYDAKVGI